MIEKTLKNQSGYIAVEWAMLTLLMVLALFAPVPGGDQSIIQIMISAIRGFYANMSFLISLP